MDILYFLIIVALCGVIGAILGYAGWGIVIGIILGAVIVATNGLNARPHR